MKHNIRNISLALFSTVCLMTLACGGGKVVVIPMPSSTVPSSSNLVTSPAPAQVVVSTIPATPPLPEDTVASVNPGPGYVWVPGYYNWLGDHYIWVPGTWAKIPNPAAMWVAGHWEPTNNGYAWISGHWQ